MILTETELSNAILEELQRNTVLTLATAGKAGPHAVSLMYAHDAFDIYWFSDPNTRHSADLVSDASATVAIAAQCIEFERIRGLQLAGHGRRITDADEESGAFNMLTARYSFLNRFAAGKLARHLGAAAVYLFRPTRLTLIDNSRGFGFKQTLRLKDLSGDPG